jgi:hypothetical protein
VAIELLQISGWPAKRIERFALKPFEIWHPLEERAAKKRPFVQQLDPVLHLHKKSPFASISDG